MLSLLASAAHAGPITYTSSGALVVTSGTDLLGWAGKTISISSTVTSMTPMAVTNLTNGGVQEVYSALINITGFQQSNMAGTMTLTWYPGSSGTDAVSVAMTYSNFGLVTTVTETLENVNLPNATPAALLNAVLLSPFDKVTVTSNWGENATFGVNGSMASLNGSTDIAVAPEPATFVLIAASLMLGGFVLLLRRRRAPVSAPCFTEPGTPRPPSALPRLRD